MIIAKVDRSERGSDRDCVTVIGGHLILAHTPTTDRMMTGIEMHLMKWMGSRALVCTALVTSAAVLSPAVLSPAAAQNGGDDPIPATTEAGEAVLLNADGTWEWATAEQDEQNGDDGDAPAAIGLRELIDRVDAFLGDLVAVEAQIRCFSQNNCDIISDDGAFYARENVDVVIADLDRADRLALLDDCGRFAARCPVTVIATADINRYDALVLRAVSIER